MFYQGTLQEGISTAVGQQKLVLCFVTNENDESRTWENEYLQDSSLSKLIETQAVALRLIAESEEAGYLSQIFPLPKTPTVVIMKHGELKEYISAGTSKDDFLRRILVAFNAAPPAASVSAAAASSSSLPSPASSPASSPTRLAAPVPAAASASVLAPAPSTSPSQTQSHTQTQAPPASVQAAAQSEIVNRILAERAAKLKAQKEEAERRAKEERAKAQEKAKAEAQAGANTDGARVHQQAEELRKKRMVEQEERRRILKRIEDDREERRMRASAKEQQKIESQKAEDVVASKQSKLSPIKKVSEMASIQVRLFDGSTIRSRFKTASPLKEVRSWVDENRGENKAPYTFKQVLTPLPNKNIDATEEGKTLGELGLIPSSTLVLIPVQKYSSAYSVAEQQQQSFFSKFLATILGFFTWLLSLVGLGSGQRAAAGERGQGRGDAAARTASEERNRRVRGLQNLQRDHQLYNGNSLNFEPRPDDDET
ncbi:hypothetical protein V8C42DRAFT_315625 [Trichoderma barbatum]